MASLDDAVSALKGITGVLSSIYKVVNQIFPQATGTATTATAGGATLPATPAGFIITQLPDGTSVKVAFYNT